MHEQIRRREGEITKHLSYKDDPISFIRDHRISFNNQNNFKCENLPILDFEVDMVKFFHENKFSITKKSRQMHLSTLAASYCAWKMLFSEDYAIGIVSQNMDESIRFIEHVRIILQNYSNDLFHWEDDFVKNNKSEIRLSNGCNIKAFSANANCGRGYKINMYVFDEAAFMNLEVVIKNIIPILSSLKDYKCIIYSTPSDTNYFYKLWSGAINGENEFSTKHIDWTVNPYLNKDMEIRDGKNWSPWYENMCKILNYEQDKIDSELNGLFKTNQAPASMRLNLRMGFELYQRMNQKISSENTNLSEYIRRLVERDLD